MVNPWRHNSMESPWKTHGKFIWPKPHGKLMDCTTEFLLNTERPDKFHGKCVGSSIDIPYEHRWNLPCIFHGMLKKPSIGFPWNCHITAIQPSVLSCSTLHGNYKKVPWKIHGTFHGFSMECPPSLPLVFHGIAV